MGYINGQDGVYMRGTLKFTGQTVNSNLTYWQENVNCEYLTQHTELNNYNQTACESQGSDTTSYSVNITFHL